MKSKTIYVWTLGLSIIVMFIFVNVFVFSFQAYVYSRLSINRDVLAMILWLLPCVASFVVSYYSEKYKFLLGMSYLLILPPMAALVHYVIGEVGVVVDFKGYHGALIVLKIYAVISTILMLIGTFFGIFLSKNRS